MRLTGQIEEFKKKQRMKKTIFSKVKKKMRPCLFTFFTTISLPTNKEELPLLWMLSVTHPPD
jgi:hypothetical protein